MAPRIGILTWHRVINPGAVLQAYCQARAFQAHFPTADVRVVDMELSGFRRARQRHALSEAVRFNFKTFREFALYQRFVRRNLPLGPPRMDADAYAEAVDALEGRYDVLVVGSDELWVTISNLNGLPFPNIFWLSPRLSAKKVAFAVSANTCGLEDIGPGDRLRAREVLSSFDFVAVRDGQTQSLVRGLSPETDVTRIPDPTFTYELHAAGRRDAVGLKMVRAGMIPGRRVLGVYGYLSPVSEPLVREVARRCRSRGWQVVSLMYDHDFVDVSLRGKLDPFEWAAAFGHCDMCVTNTFHGTIFNLLNGTPFISLGEGEQALRYVGKVQDLLVEMGIEHHYRHSSDLTSDSLFDLLEHVRSTFDRERVASKLGVMRGRYLDGLRSLASVLDLPP